MCPIWRVIVVGFGVRSVERLDLDSKINQAYLPGRKLPCMYADGTRWACSSQAGVFTFFGSARAYQHYIIKPLTPTPPNIDQRQWSLRVVHGARLFHCVFYRGKAIRNARTA